MSENARTETRNQKGPLPLVFGVTGHRDLREEDTAALEARVETIFRDFLARYPHTPLLLLSPLAEGADRLVARVALQCGVRLLSPLPMPREEYVRDFSPESQREFDALLKQALWWFELPLLFGNTRALIEEKSDSRAAQYTLVGAHIVRHCQVLIALWDGVETNSEGGTSQIVQFQREGLPDTYREALSEADTDVRNLLEPAEQGEVYHILTPRRSNPNVAGEIASLKIHLPGEDGHASPQHPTHHREHHTPAATRQRIFANMDTFNADVLHLEHTPDLKRDCARNADYLLPDAEAAELPPALQALRQRYAVADTLAQYYQKLTLKTLGQLCIYVFIAALAFEITAKLTPNSGSLALIFPVLVGTIWIFWFSTVKRQKWQDRFQDYRALAEGLRVEFFWRMAGIKTSVADHYLRKQRGELNWIRIAIRNMLGEAILTPKHDSKAAIALVIKRWVADQARYHARAAHRDHNQLEKYETWVKMLVLCSPLLALLTAIAMLLPTPVAHFLHEVEISHKLLIILVFALAGLGGVIHTYTDKRALSQHVKQYERMATVFDLAEDRLNRALKADNLELAQDILIELGKESLAENGDWVLTHRERPVEVPHAG